MAGVSCGFLGTTIMTYLSEMAIPQMRGSLLATFSLAFALGQLFCAIGLQVLQEVSGIPLSSPREPATHNRISPLHLPSGASFIPSLSF
jgi:MFS family permease